MFIKYVLTPLRMDKKKRYRKTFVQTWRPRNYPVAIRYFCIIFLSIQWKVTHRRRQKRRREQENTFNTRKIAEIGKIVVCVSCVLWSFISFEKIEIQKGPWGSGASWRLKLKAMLTVDSNVHADIEHMSTNAFLSFWHAHWWMGINIVTTDVAAAKKVSNI